MPFEQPSPPNLITRLSHQPRHMLEGMVPISEPAKRSAIRREPDPLAFGLLDKMPLELLHLVLSMLDLRSLSRISRVSLQGQAVVESLPAYRDLMDYAPHAIKALGQTGLIRYHTAAMLQATLFSKSCISCGEYGAFLFLPTCERCCYECLLWNQSLGSSPWL
jgi:hypothetical protein